MTSTRYHATLALVCAVALVSCDAFGGSDDPLSISNGHGPFFGFLLDHEEDYLAVSSEGPDFRYVVYLFARDADGRWDSGQLVDLGEDVHFGWNMSVSGSTVAITSTKEDAGRGAVYVYVHDGGQWQQQARLPAPEGVHPQDTHGRRVSLDGDWLFVEHSSAHLEGTSQADSTRNAGRVLVYKRSADQRWTLAQQLRPSDPAPFHQFGAAVTLDGDRALVASAMHGATNNITDGDTRGYVFELEGDRWVEQSRLVPPASAQSSLGLQNIALEGDWAAIGNTAHADESGRGVVDLFRREGSEWRHAQRLRPSSPFPTGFFGTIVKLDGDRLVVSDPSGDGAGSVYVFERSGATWQEAARIQAPEPARGDFFGEGLSVSGEEIVVGAPGANDEQGAVYVLRRSGSGWDYVEP